MSIMQSFDLVVEQDDNITPESPLVPRKPANTKKRSESALKPRFWSASIESSSLEEKLGDEYTLYRLSVKFGSEHWTLLRRYSEFYDLNQKLVQEGLDVGGQFPEKTWPVVVDKNDPEIVEARKVMLDTFLNRLASEFPKKASVLEFLKPVRNEAQLKPVLSISIRSIKYVPSNCIDPYNETQDTWWPSLYESENEIVGGSSPMVDLEKGAAAVSSPTKAEIGEDKATLRARIYQLRQEQSSQANGLSSEQQSELEACVAKLRALS